MEPEVGELLDQPLVGLGDGGERLGAFLPDLAGDGRGAGVEQPGDVQSSGRVAAARRRRARAAEASTTRPRCGTPVYRGCR